MHGKKKLIDIRKMSFAKNANY